MREKGLTAIALKKINRAKVYHYIYEERLTSKLQIVKDLQMGLSTVSQNLVMLEEEGLIDRNGSFDSTGGRKAQVIRIVPDVKISLGVGILKNMFHIAAVDLYGEAVHKDTFCLSYENSEGYYDEITGRIKEFMKEKGYREDQVLGISIATQGIIAPDGTCVTYGPIMDNQDMKLEDFASRLPYACCLEHDSKAAACLELWNHRELDSALVFLLNQNLGGAVITNHSVHKGFSMHSGTIEHLCIDPAGPACYCGKKGCLETYCSANALEEEAGVSAEDFFKNLRKNERGRFREIWESYLFHLALAMRNCNMVIDSPVIISGYLAPYFTEEDLEYLLKEINALSPFPMLKNQLILGTHGQYTPAIGAALSYVKTFISQV